MIVYYRFAGVVCLDCSTLQPAHSVGCSTKLTSYPHSCGYRWRGSFCCHGGGCQVLVFERIERNFLIERIASALQAGYRRALVRSSIPTPLPLSPPLFCSIFDSGPIKGFAVTLIIGIISSLFSALFMTRYFFMNWVQNPNTPLSRCIAGLKSTHLTS